jgi:hypothetical protein
VETNEKRTDGKSSAHQLSLPGHDSRAPILTEHNAAEVTQTLSRSHANRQAVSREAAQIAKVIFHLLRLRGWREAICASAMG